MSLDQEEIQRFAGGKKGGRLRVGAISANGALGNKASIPSRFETVLNSGVRERNAFGRRTYRFDDPENDLPGPGSYKKSRTLIKPAQNFSKKGSAAFASAEKAGFKDSAPPIVGPGPGQYSLADISPTKSAGSAAFAKPMPRKLLKIARPNTVAPGPGEYVIDRNRRVPCAAMSDKAVRDTSGLVANNVPGPGEYVSFELASSFVVKEPERVSYFNGSHTDRFGNPIKPDGAPRSVAPALLRVMPETSGERLPKIVGDVVTSSKPVSPPRDFNAPPAQPRKSPMFADTLLDRFGNPTVRFTADDSDAVGPGSYYHERTGRRMLISSAWALSAVPRDQKKDKYVPPGPAYYSAKVPPRHSSHHVVSAEYWS